MRHLGTWLLCWQLNPTVARWAFDYDSQHILRGLERLLTVRAVELEIAHFIVLLLADRDRTAPCRAALPHHRAYGSRTRRFRCLHPALRRRPCPFACLRLLLHLARRLPLRKLRAMPGAWRGSRDRWGVPQWVPCSRLIGHSLSIGFLRTPRASPRSLERLCS